MRVKGRQNGGRSPLRASLQLSICVLAVLQILHPSMLLVNGQEEDAAAASGGGGGEKKPVNVTILKAYIKHHHNQDMSVFTYEQLEQWFLNKSDKYRVKPWDYPRAFPFCVTRKQIIQGHDDPSIEDQTEEDRNKNQRVPRNSKLYRFKRYFYGVELRRKKYYQFEPTLDSTLHNHSFVESIEFSRINTPEPDMVNLRQWVHITVKMTEPMVGLYMQSIVGPFGLPFGEFSVEFPCADRDSAKDLDTVGELAYCSHRPKTHIYHPSAYVGFNEEIDQLKTTKVKTVYKGKMEFHVHFKWFDLTCLETPYVQFLMLIVKNDDLNPKYGIDYVAQMSPVFLNTDFDSRDGSPYPYHPSFDKMFCFLKNQDQLKEEYKKLNPQKVIRMKPGADQDHVPISWTQETTITRIQPNEEYDSCILHGGVNETKPNETSYECGPGPFECDDDLEQNKYRIKELREALVVNERNLSTCVPCGIPECTKIGFLTEYCGVELPPLNNLEAETLVLTDLDDNTRIRAHGVSGMLSFLIFIPIGQFVGRFYKEVMGKCLFGNGPWVFVHLMCSMLAVAATWTSMGPMIPTLAAIRARRKVCLTLYNSTKHPEFQPCIEGYEIKSAHTVSGLIAMIFLHVVPIFGFIRPPSNKIRFLMSAIHSTMGYFTYLLGVLAVFLAIQDPRCVDTLVFCIILIILPLVFSGIVFALDMIADKRMGVRPARKQWPVLEQLQLESRGPLEWPKLIVLIIFLVLIGIVWLLALVSLHIVEDSGDELLKGVNDFKGNKAKYLGRLQGLFGECGSQTVKETVAEDEEENS